MKKYDFIAKSDRLSIPDTDRLTLGNEIILENLEKGFAETVSKLLNNCRSKGVEIQLREGIRNTFAQAVYWRRSRSREELENKIVELKSMNADFLAYCLFVVGEQEGSHATDAIPGLSWHQYGLAVDCAWILNGKVCWDNSNLHDGLNGYEVLAIEAEKLKVQSGHLWSSIRDSGHLQAPVVPSPLHMYSLQKINSLMQERYLYLLDKT